MSFKVTYSGLNSNQPGKSPWADIIPYVSVEEARNWNSNLLNKEFSVTLNGSLTQSGFNALSSNYANYGYSSNPTTNLVFPTGYIKIVKDAFSNCYGQLIATDVPNVGNPTVILSGLYYVDSISFDNQNYINLINYSVQLKSYSGLKYSGIEPSEEINIREDGNGIVDISHRISAIGVGPAFEGDTPISFDSVKTFVQNSTGVSRLKNLMFGSGFVPTGSGFSGVYVSGAGIGTSHSSNLILISQTESINRLTNTYGIEEQFKIDNLRSSPYGTKRFSVDLNSGIASDYVIVDVSCVIEGAKDKNFSDVSGLLNNITGQMYEAATGIINNPSLPASSGLCKTPINFSISTNRLITGHADASSITNIDGSSQISVSCSFDNSSEGTFFDYEVSYNSDEIEQFNSLNINGVIKGRGLHTAQKFADASGYLFTTLLSSEQDIKTMLYNKAVAAFSSMAPTSNASTCGIIGERGGQSFGFVKDKGEANVSFNTGKGEITLNANYSDEPSVSGYNQFEWSCNVEVGVPLLVIQQSLNQNGFNIIQDIGTSGRCFYDFNGNFSFASGAEGVIPILTKASQPHTGILSKLIIAEGFPILSGNSVFETSGIILENYDKEFDFVSGTQASSNDYLSSGFRTRLSKSKQDTLSVYKTYSVTQ